MAATGLSVRFPAKKRPHGDGRGACASAQGGGARLYQSVAESSSGFGGVVARALDDAWALQAPSPVAVCSSWSDRCSSPAWASAFAVARDSQLPAPPLPALVAPAAVAAAAERERVRLGKK